MSSSLSASDVAPGPIHLVLHRRGAWRLRWFPGHLEQLQILLDRHSFWAAGRSKTHLRRMLRASQTVVSAWQRGRLVGFGRATSDGVFRAVIWDVVVANDRQGQGLGKRLMGALLEQPGIQAVERVYVMTTNCEGFYEQLGFDKVENQALMLKERDSQR